MVAMPTQNIPVAVTSSSLAFMAYGASGVVVHLYAVDKAHPYFFVILRLTFSTPLLFIASVIAEGGVPRRPQRLREVLHILLIGVLSVILSIAVTLSYFLTNTLAVGISQLCLPILVTTISVLTKTEEKPDFSKVHGWVGALSIVPTLSGAVTLVFLTSKNEKEAPEHCGLSKGAKSQQANWSLGSVFLAVFLTTFAAYIIVQKRLYLRYKEWSKHSITVTAWGNLLAYPVVWIFFPAAVAIIKPKTSCGEIIDLWTLEGTAVWALEYYTFINATSCLMLLAFASACASPSVVTFFTPIDPMAAVVLSHLFLDYSTTAGEYFCMAAVLCGFFAFIWAQHKEEIYRKEREQRGTASSESVKDLRKTNADLLYKPAVCVETSV